MMKFSVITVCFNASKTLRCAIDSVLFQEGIELEYILVDGASKDDSCEIVKSYGQKISHFLSEPDQGIYDAMNKGINIASGEVVAILNSDDFYSDEFVLRDVAMLFGDNIDAVYGDLVYVDQLNTERVKRTWKSGNYKHGAFRRGWMPPHPAFFVRREVYEKFGGYSLKLKSAADYEFMLRVIHRHEIRLAYLNRVLVRMRTGGKSNVSLRNRWKANREDRQAWRMNGLKPSAFTVLIKPMRKIGQFFRR